MQKISLLICLLLVGLITHAQDIRKLGMNPTWYEGSLQLKSTDKLEGLIYYNTNFGTIQYKSKSQGETISFQENRVMKMHYFDPKLNRTRHYSAITYIDTLTDKIHETLFEVFKDFGDFVVLSRISKAALLFPSNYNPNSITILQDFGVPADKMFVQVEGIFFIDKRNKLALFCLIKDMDYDGLLYDYQKSKSKIIQSEVLEDYTKDHWISLEKYIKENKLKPKLKDDLVRILDHYEHLRASGN
jgi:hypothetical protein